MEQTKHDNIKHEDAPLQTKEEQQDVPKRIGKRNGAVQLEFFDKDEYQRKLEGVLEGLRKSVLEFKYDTKSLKTLLAGMQQFLEDAYGKDVRVLGREVGMCVFPFKSEKNSLVLVAYIGHTIRFLYTPEIVCVYLTEKVLMQALIKPFPKLPMKVFHDFRPHGSVAAIAKMCAGVLKTKKHRRIDWTSPANRRENSELISRIRQELLRSGFMKNPKIYLHTSLSPESLGKLRNAVTKMGGQLAQTETESGVTHIIHPNSKQMEQNDGEEYLRTLERKGYFARIHWWFLPDSYDEWVPSAYAPDDIDPDLPPPNSRPWHVYERWVYDSFKFNEWMNEGDYETESSQEANRKLREMGAGTENDAQEPQKKMTKKEMRIADQKAEVASEALHILGPGVIQRDVLVVNKRATEGVGPAIDISHGYRQQWMGPQVGSKRKDTQADNHSNGLKQHSIPFASTWFDKNSVHYLERREFPELEVSDYEMKEYKIVRNHIIEVFERDPDRELLYVDVSQDIYTDGFLALKIFKFLNRWGIINHFDSDASGYIPVDKHYVWAPAGVDSVLSLEKRIKVEDGVYMLASGGKNCKTVVRHGTLTNRLIEPTGKFMNNNRIFCTAFPWIECSSDYYSHIRNPDVTLCPEAYADGRFPPGTSAKDFQRVLHGETQILKGQSKEWSQQENLLLLEALDLYQDDWDKVSNHVGGRTKTECIQHLLALPIEDSLVPFALDLHNPFPSLVMGEDGRPEVPNRYASVPFEKSPNPVISLLSVLLSVISSEIAGVAAKGCLETLLKEVDDVKSPIPSEVSRKAVAHGLEIAAIRAKQLSQQHIQEMQETALSMSEVQLKRIMAKLEYAEGLERVLVEETAEATKKAYDILKQEP